MSAMEGIWRCLKASARVGLVLLHTFYSGPGKIKCLILCAGRGKCFWSAIATSPSTCSPLMSKTVTGVFIGIATATLPPATTQILAGKPID